MQSRKEVLRDVLNSCDYWGDSEFIYTFSDSDIDRIFEECTNFYNDTLKRSSRNMVDSDENWENCCIKYKTIFTPLFVKSLNPESEWIDIKNNESYLSFLDNLPIGSEYVYKDGSSFVHVLTGKEYDESGKLVNIETKLTKSYVENPFWRKNE